jgi:UDP-glucose 4-epimerase
VRLLVTGGAGYIGSVVTEQLITGGHSVTVIDNLEQGHREAIAPEAAFVEVDLADSQALNTIFEGQEIQAVIHLAAETRVGHSMTNPRGTFHNNVVCGFNLLDAMLKHGVFEIVFSSSAAVYGNPGKMPIEEADTTKPVNPYGESKLMFERILHWYRAAYGLRFISLRYFNVAGASQRFGEDHHPETHLVPNILKTAIGHAEQLFVFGDDYPTQDGSCIRDYIHVIDVARAHILALKHLGENARHSIYNLGNGKGFSVFEVIKAARKITGAQIPISLRPRRQGDPAVLVADARLAKTELGWEPEFSDIEHIIRSAWRWQTQYPHGYS